MVKEFRGQVKVSDIQAEFDALVSKINELVDVYNTALDAGNISLEDGSEALAPIGYALSVGGLKSVLNAYNGYLIGCNVFKVGSTYVVTNGMYIMSNAVWQVPGGIVNGTAARYVGYNGDTQQWWFTSTKPVLGREVNTMRTDSVTICNTENCIARKSNLKIFTGNKSPLDSTKDTIYDSDNCFCGGSSGSVWGKVYLLGTLISNNWRPGSRNGKFCVPFLTFFKPRGIANPFYMEGDNNEWGQQKFEVIEKE